MIKLLFSVILLLSVNCFSQERECLYPPSANFTGTCESLYSNGNIQSKTDFLNGLRNGDYREYYKNGQLAASASFFRESYIGECYRYSKDSSVVFKMVLDSTETGYFIKYSNDGKRILATGQFKKSFRDGEWSFYDESGKLIRSLQYDSDETRNEIYNEERSSIIIPYDETIDKLFFDDYGRSFEITVTPETIIDSPDIDAYFPNGKDKMRAFINEMVNYPEPAIKDKQEGKVYLSFIVELDGSLTDIKVMRGVSQELDKEAIRLIEIMPNWTPAVYKGQKVRTRCFLPISFTLNANK